MSYEHFETLLSADIRTAPNGRDVEWAPAGQGQPRLVDQWDERTGRHWFTTYPYAHDVLAIVADAIEQTEMDGISGDHPEKRAYLAGIARALGAAVNDLAADAACDGSLTTERWQGALDRLTAALESIQPSEEGR